MLSENAFPFLIIVFTGVKPDNLDVLLESSEELFLLCTRCRGNYLSLGDNTDEAITRQLTDLFFNRLDMLFRSNGNSAFYHPSFEKASKILMSDAKRIQKQNNIPIYEALDQARQRALIGRSNQDRKLFKLFIS